MFPYFTQQTGCLLLMVKINWPLFLYLTHKALQMCGLGGGFYILFNCRLMFFETLVVFCVLKVTLVLIN